ncbi:hypothetical protein LX32DRAFT_637456 [Colletotrichum zoysiae]|uniref:Uncharacterized protein n=1 Tax=Colletotrichum zoysiae TaxID=1216348 RepID=A0AAD9HLX1_9PEZI|nr:hypothetical protein LX32DRAFT_637456 [Colletotrichum zoysiae]
MQIDPFNLAGRTIWSAVSHYVDCGDSTLPWPIRRYVQFPSSWLPWQLMSLASVVPTTLL